MSLFRPQYKDKKTGERKQTGTWWYKFTFAGRLIRESAKTASKTVAREAERRRRRELEQGFNGIGDTRNERVSSIRQLANAFMKDYRVRQPRSACFADHALAHVTRLLGDLLAVDVTDKTIVRYQTARLSEGAAPKTINEEVALSLRLLPITQAGAVRAQLKQQKQLKLKVRIRVEEKTRLISAAKSAPRSRGILLATMLAQHGGMRDKEIRTVQWSRFDLSSRIVQVGDSKTDAGTGRRIPMNDDLFVAALEYSNWYIDRFGYPHPDWYVFPAGRPVATDPTKPQTTMKTAWRNTRSKANGEGRFHDNRHTFVTDLAEAGVGDEVIRELAGYVSKDMIRHYSHIRLQSRRQAVAKLAAKSVGPD